MSKKLEGKVAVVTGASKGIGAAIAKALAAEGASVIVNYASSKEGADKVVADIAKQGGQAVAVQADVSKQADITQLFSETKSIYGQLDILVNNAGVYEFAPLEQVSEEHFHKQFNLNVLGLLLTTKEALALFSAAGGSVINISSAVTTLFPPNSSVYTATKGAVDSLTGVLAKELGSRKIRVNAINPGLIATEGTHTGGFAEGDMKAWVETSAPLARIGQVDDIAPTAVYLASEDSKYITGATINIAGGMK
ncbi:glucose 1-dehydrogenase [Methylobacillus gramineus]|uniref:SDR family NAD(P)-dependent oxidoreductase n=1 Tax=Methylobacillus gramineus TaxID=755169 RepID=UPI001CFF86D7|nr:glucose 1-dehydrogenase [Methylobacillus gramineus]MCB5184962.1 glucose 1-dehydrogenase [Methylobacillus gramineus]